MTLWMKNARLVTPSGVVQGNLHVESGRIAALGALEIPDEANVVDARDGWLLPGFIDVHVHGGVGCEAMDADPDGLRQMARFYAAHGVTSFLPTTWTAPYEDIMAALETIAAVQREGTGGAAILGAHVEGPYLNPARCGAQDSRQIRRAGQDEATAILDTGLIRLMALAPEYVENRWLIEECVRRGIVVSAAHTAATYADMQVAVRLGLSQTTHTYNAMTGLHHREPGTLGAALTIDAISCELIADNVHVHPAAMNLLYRAKGPDRTILITDAVRGAGLPEGTSYDQDGRPVVVRDGAAYLPGDTLAGSTLSMDRALRNFIAASGAPLEVVWPATSRTAARQLGIADRKGSLEVGKDADLVLLDADLNVRLTVVGGYVVYQGE
ncbi:MAG: N-acetylglucosamine-6-phosphate deacetylase [Anaerolineae bacterium]